jgi:hypothetical protein
MRTALLAWCALCVCALSAFAEEMSSSKYKVIFSATTASLSHEGVSGSYLAKNVVMGGVAPGSSAETQSANATINFVDLYFAPLLSEWQFYQISEIRVRENRLGPEIFPETWTNDDDPYFFWIMVSENENMISGYSFSVDEEPDTEVDVYDSYYQYADDAFPEGVHEFFVRARNTRGMWGPAISFKIWVDATAPDVDDEMPVSGTLLRGDNVEVSCMLSDAASGVSADDLEMTINETAVKASLDPETMRYRLDEGELKNGENIVTVRVKDVAGNETVKTWSFVLDNEQPEGSVTINNGDRSTDNAYVTLKLDARDAISGVSKVYIATDGSMDQSDYQHPAVYAPLMENVLLADAETPGMKTVVVVFEDAAGNRSEPVSARITLTVGAPDTRIVSAPDTVTQEAAAEFVFASSRSDALFSYSLDDGSYSEWTTADQVTFSELPVGSHVFKVRAAVDMNGDGQFGIAETDQSPAQWVWSVMSERDADEATKEKVRKTLYYKRN